jgi:predicted RNA-binding Zn ribbon-like protein
VSEFFWVGNHPGVDLFNTAAANDNGEPVELLDGFDALARWLGDSQLVARDDVRAVPARQRSQLVRWARRLRDAGRQVVDRDVARAVADPDLDAVVADVPVRLAHSGATGGNTPVEATTSHDRIRLALALAVLDATRLDRSRLRRCGRQGCVLLFFDTSMNGARRWCDMAVCGNRVKAAAHYDRVRSSTCEGQVADAPR